MGSLNGAVVTVCGHCVCPLGMGSLSGTVVTDSAHCMWLSVSLEKTQESDCFGYLCLTSKCSMICASHDLSDVAHLGQQDKQWCGVLCSPGGSGLLLQVSLYTDGFKPHRTERYLMHFPVSSGSSS